MAAGKKGKTPRNKSAKATTPVSKSATSKPQVLQPNRMRSALQAEHAFVNHYVIDNNGARAVMYCGAFNPKNLHVAGVMAVELLGRPSVQALLTAARAKQRQYAESKYAVTADRVIQELAYCGFSNMTDYITVTEDGSAYVDLSLLRDPSIGPMLGAAIQKVESEHYIDHEEVDKDGTKKLVKKVKIQLHEKRQALLELGKITGDPRFLRSDNNEKNPQLVAQQMLVVFNNMQSKLLS